VQTEHTVPAAEGAAVVAVSLLGALAGGKFFLPIRLVSRLPSTYDDWHEAAHKLSPYDARNDGRRSGKAETHVLAIGILVTIVSFGVADFLLTSRITVRLVAAHRDFGWGCFFLTGGAQFFSFTVVDRFVLKW
jgi:hypothetical protein